MHVPGTASGRPATDASLPALPDPAPRWVAGVAAAGVAGIVWYVGAWVVAGRLTAGYDPFDQAISELFAIGAPTAPAMLLRSALLGSGILLVAFAFALDRGLPGTGVAGPAAAAVSGVMTVLAVVWPCGPGCPGFGASTTDSLHTVVAGTGYVALIVTPLLVALRVRDQARALAGWSVALGSLAALGFVVRVAGLMDDLGGLQQRSFNTTADVWYVVAGLWLVGHVRRTRRSRQ